MCKRPSFIGAGSMRTVRTDLSELFQCEGRRNPCTLPHGEHERQEAINLRWRGGEISRDDAERLIAHT
jgi:hypothetical protein